MVRIPTSINLITLIGYNNKTNAQFHKDQSHVEAFWKWFPDLYKTLEVFRITGGETNA